MQNPRKMNRTERRDRLLRVSLLILSSLLFFGLLEVGLRMGGYGYPTGFFLGPDTAGKWTTNFRFGWRFFPRSLSRAPHPCILSSKPAGSIRIFVLGGSAAMGTPDPAFSFGRILEVMLREQYPGTRFEVVNGAMTAINSHVVLEIAQDCEAHEPDLFVVYLGNNEVVGPYGPGTVFQQWSPRLPVIRASLMAKSTRVGQLLGDVAGYFRRAGGTPVYWRGMEMFLDNPVAADDPRLTAVYDHCRQNLIDICEVAHLANARVVLSTVAVNMQDCPPFASLHRPGLSSADLAKWEGLYRAGCELEAMERWPEAIDQYEAAAKIDEGFAELLFRLGTCLMQVGRVAEARDRFESARNCDVLRFRADSRINAIIREVAGAQKSAGIHLADAERALAENDPDLKGIWGGGLFYEHVHLTFEGNYQLARSIFYKICEALPQLATLPKQGAIASRQRCAELLALTTWDEAQLADSVVAMTAKAPFQHQLHHSLRQTAARRRRDELGRLAATPLSREAAWKTYKAALANTPDDWSLHQRFGMLARQGGRPDVAAAHLRIALARMPGSASLHNNLGNALADQGESDEAIAHYRRALAINPNYDTAHYGLGNVLAGRGQSDEAIAHYRKALEVKPDYGSAHYNLANVLASRGQVDEAIIHFQKALEIKPDEAQVHSNFGVALVSRGRVDEAIAHFQKAVEIKPGDASILRNLELALSERKEEP